MTTSADRRLPPVIWALAVCFFTFGTGEFVVPGLLLDISRDLSVPASTAGRLVSGITLLAYICDLRAGITREHAHA